MVATRSIENVVSYVTGNEELTVMDISSEQWVEILRAAVKELPLNYMRGFMSIQQIIAEHENSCRLPRVISGPFRPRLLWSQRPNQVYLACAEFGDKFPMGNVYESWPTAPRELAEDGVTEIGLAVLRSDHVLLSRKGVFYHLMLLWNPREEWDPQSLSSVPAKFWYEADLESPTLTALDDGGLCQLIEVDSARVEWEPSRFPRLMLFRLHDALTETSSVLRDQYDQVRYTERQIQEYIDRSDNLTLG